MMAAELRVLKSAARDIARQRLKRAFAAAIKRDPPISGFGLVTFRRRGSEVVTSWANYGADDVLDIFVIPELARLRLEEEIKKDSTPIDA